MSLTLDEVVTAASGKCGARWPKTAPSAKAPACNRKPASAANAVAAAESSGIFGSAGCRPRSNAPPAKGTGRRAKAAMPARRAAKRRPANTTAGCRSRRARALATCSMSPHECKASSAMMGSRCACAGTAATRIVHGRSRRDLEVRVPVDGFAWMANRWIEVPTARGLQQMKLRRGYISYRIKNAGLPWAGTRRLRIASSPSCRYFRRSSAGSRRQRSIGWWPATGDSRHGGRQSAGGVEPFGGWLAAPATLVAAASRCLPDVDDPNSSTITSGDMELGTPADLNHQLGCTRRSRVEYTSRRGARVGGAHAADFVPAWEPK